MRCPPSSLLAPLGAAVLLLAACAAPAAVPTAAPKAPAVAPTSPPKSEAAPAKPTIAPAQPKSEPAPDKPVATDSSRALADAKAKYYEAAKQEGKLVVYGTTLSPALFDPIKDAFNKLFPGIDIRAEEQTGNISREKIIAEQLAKSYVVDLAFTGFSTTRDLIDAGFVVPYESPQASALIPEFVLPGGLVNPRNASLLSVTVNTNLVPPDQEPKVWNDILDPKWKGKLATQDPRQPGGGGQIISGLALVYGFEWLDQLKKQDVFYGPGPGPLWNGLIRGEYAMFLAANHADAVSHRKAGAPIKFLKMQDGVSWTYNSMLNIANQPHPNAARLFIEWVISEEGQLAMSTQGFGAVRKGVRAVEPEASMEGVTFLPRDNTPEADAILGNDQERSVRWDNLLFK